MSDLNTAILAKIEESGNKMMDSDQRSALGMARSWVEHGKLDTWNPERHKDMIEYKERDQLAKDLVAILETSRDADEQIGALAAAREVINRPYFDPRSNGAKTGKANPEAGRQEESEG